MEIHKDTSKNKSIHLVLVPHRDSRGELRKYNEALFTKGLSGVYPFPLVALLASLSRPLNRDELKNITRSIRKAAGKEKISASDAGTVCFPACENGMALFGPRLNIDIPGDFSNHSQKITALFSPIILGSFLIPKKHEYLENTTALSDLYGWHLQSGSLTFRACAVANLFWRPVRTGKNDEEICYKWKIGELCWLPRV